MQSNFSSKALYTFCTGVLLTHCTGCYIEGHCSPMSLKTSPQVRKSHPKQCQNEELSSRFNPTCTKQVDGSCTQCLQVNLFTLRCAAAIALKARLKACFKICLQL
jgi:hypothetical protein